MKKTNREFRMKTLIAIAALLLGQNLLAAETCVINGLKKELPAGLSRSDIALHVHNSAGARSASLYVKKAARVQINTRADELQIIRVAFSKDQADNIQCDKDGTCEIVAWQGDSPSYREAKVRIPGKFEVNGTKFHVTIVNGVRKVNIIAKRPISIHSTSGWDKSQDFQLLSRTSRISASCAPFVKEQVKVDEESQAAADAEVLQKVNAEQEADPASPDAAR
jgi:hypothetical protein